MNKIFKFFDLNPKSSINMSELINIFSNNNNHGNFLMNENQIFQNCISLLTLPQNYENSLMGFLNNNSFMEYPKSNLNNTGNNNNINYNNKMNNENIKSNIIENIQ
jgi:hypothetical protein